MRHILLAVFVVGLNSACSSEVGSDAWCKSLKGKHKADWSMRGAKDYTKHCLFK